MTALDWLTAGATIISGIVSLILLVSLATDAVTQGWVQQKVRDWLLSDMREDMEDLKADTSKLRSDHHDTQNFLIDLGSSYNELSCIVCNEHEIPDGERPPQINTRYYQLRLDDEGDTEQGDFRTSND